MPIHIYNTLTHKKEEFKPQEPHQVKMYTCGVTVYDECHIGHARSLYIFDVIRRYLEYRNFKVDFVRNITDIDDKIINRARELKVDWKELVDKYIDSYKKDLESLGVQPGILDGGDEPRATRNIPDMIKYIEGLIDKGYAYATDSGVYFSVRKFKDYGKLSGQGVDQMLSGVRIETDEHKKDPLDFALWKLSKPDEPFWESPWGKGRPGWHIECSVMSQKFLKTDTLDIHAGGRDLVFPHHENEVAQSEAFTGKPFARYWIHHGLLTINGQKMAKSLGNFITIKDFINKYRDADILKLFFLTTHYSNPIDYNDSKIRQSETHTRELANFFVRVSQKNNLPPKDIPVKLKEEIDKLKDKFISSMDDDFNTPEALACIFQLQDFGNNSIAQEQISLALYIKDILSELLGIFGLADRMKGAKDLPAHVNVLNDDEIESLIKQRDSARKNKDFRKADEIRNKLERKGVILEDTKSSTIWRRK